MSTRPIVTLPFVIPPFSGHSLTWPLTGTTWSAAAAFGFHVLADVEDQVGFLPAAATRLDRLNALRGELRGE